MQGVTRAPAALAVLMLGLAGGSAVSAQAATVNGRDDVSAVAVAVRAAPGEVNDMQVEVQTKSITVTDTGADLQAIGSCVNQGARKVICTAKEPFDSVDIYLGDGDDHLVLSTRPPASPAAHMFGGPGNDTIEQSGPSRAWTGARATTP